ncbi:MAG: hypothetical protein K2H36_05905 [Clostridia bacterium]|nr:hypothetical protein [Clostridia bacterium]
MRKTRLLIIVIALVAVVFCVCLTACSKNQNYIKTQDSVVSRFGDGIVVLDSHAAPANAHEYKDQLRVRAKINVDARLSGYHITGIYLPAGETLTIDVSNTIAQFGYSVLVNNFTTGNRVTRLISSVRTTIEPSDAPNGGVVEILVPEVANSSTAANSFNMRIEGGIVMPYYRLGRDDVNQIESGGGDYAILDCVNARFYIPTDVLYGEDKECVIRDDIYNSLLWWQSAVSFFNETLEIPSNSSEYTSSVVFGNFGTGLSYDGDRKAVVADKSFFQDYLAYDNLIQGKAWDLLYAICDHKVNVSENFSDSVAETMIVDVLCSIDNVVMTHFDVATESDWKWLINPYTCLENTLELFATPQQARDTSYERDVIRAFFINIMHSFGLDKTINIIVAYGQIAPDKPSNDTLALIISEELGADMSLYFEKFGIALTQETKKKMSGNAMYIPVQTKFTVGSDKSYSLGYTVAMGERTAFDFANNMVSMSDGEWEIVGVDGDSRLWSLEDGIYYYTPSTDKLTDEFVLRMRSGVDSVSLYGKINVLITVATYKIYENWKFDNTTTALDEAVAAYQKRTPDYIGSIDFAGVRRRPNADPSVYVLTVTEGCIKVPKGGKYRIYLRNHGLCRVEFGVSKYMMTMFDSPIPVQEFTRYQSYDIVLEEDKVYEYKLYLLSTKGDCDAALGIRYIQDEDINDDGDYGIQADAIDTDYLIYKGLDRSDIVSFVPPIIYPTGYGYKEDFYQTHELKEEHFVSYPAAVVNRGINLAIDSLSTGSYYSASRITNYYEFILDLEKALRLEYLMLNVRSVSVGANVNVFVSNTEDFSSQTQLALSENVLKSGDNYMLFGSCTSRYVKITLSAEENFSCDINDLRLGQYFEESRIVPNTSSMLAYMGGWSNVGEYVSVNGSISESVNDNSIFSFTAKSRQICLYGVKDTKYGKMDIYVDGSYYTTIDLFSESTATDQLLFAIDFDTNMEHSIKAMPASKTDVINFDYISYIPVEEEQVKPIGGVLYYALIIPGVIVVVLLGAAIADRVSKTKKVRKRAHSA